MSNFISIEINVVKLVDYTKRGQHWTPSFVKVLYSRAFDGFTVN